MKQIFLNKCLKFIKNNNNSMTFEQEEIILYGLESIYLNVTKIGFIIILASILGLLKSTIILIITYNIIRTVSYGLHATKSIYCYIFSSVFFVGGAYLCEIITINPFVKVAICVICVICLFKYAPADTAKRPLLNAHKRSKFKLLSVIFAGVYTLLITINCTPFSNYLLVGMIEASVLIHPTTYKIFNMSYNNYENYLYN